MSRIISARRQIVTEQDRYGGFDRPTDFSDVPAQDKAFGEEAFRLTRAERGVDRYSDYRYDTGRERAPASLRETIQDEQVRYSGRTDYSEEIGLVPASKFAKKREPEELMPRIESPAAEKRVYFKEKAAVKPKAENAESRPVPAQKAKSITASAKMMLFIYIAAVLMLAAVVIGTGIAISRATDRIGTLEAERAAKVAQVNAQANELDKLNDPVYISGLALGEDMEKARSYTEIPLVVLSEPKVYAAPSNWFNDFCKWVSGLFG